MKRKLLIMLAMIMTIVTLTSCASKDKNNGKVTLNVYNWGDYIDPEVTKGFEKETGIKVNYEEFATNEEMLAKIEAGGTAYDVIVPSDYMIEYMGKRGLLLEIDFNNLKNYGNIDDRFKKLAYDKEGKYSVPYLWGTMGIVYNKTMVNKPVDSWNILWDKDYAGKIIMLDSPRDTIGITLKKLGYSLNTTNPVELAKAKAELIKQKSMVRSYEIDTYKDQMIAGEAALSLAWSGDGMLLMSENEDLAYAIPKEGTNLWVDGLAIPKTSIHKKEAEMFIDYMMRPEVAAANSKYIKFSTPNKEAIKLLPKEETENQFLYPKGDLNALGEVFTDLGEATTEYDKIWTEIKSS